MERFINPFIKIVVICEAILFIVMIAQILKFTFFQTV